MPLKMTNEVSVVDVFAIGGLLLGGAGVFFGLGADVNENAANIAHITTDVARIERDARAGDDKILQQLKDSREDMKGIRAEGVAGRKDIIEKLDKLIDRELNGTRGPTR